MYSDKLKQRLATADDEFGDFRHRLANHKSNMTNRRSRFSGCGRSLHQNGTPRGNHQPFCGSGSDKSSSASVAFPCSEPVIEPMSWVLFTEAPGSPSKSGNTIDTRGGRELWRRSAMVLISTALRPLSAQSFTNR